MLTGVALFFIPVVVLRLCLWSINTTLFYNLKWRDILKAFAREEWSTNIRQRKIENAGNRHFPAVEL